VAQHQLGIEYNTTTWDFTPHLHKISSEILIVAGERTERLGIAYQKEKKKYFSSPRFEIIEDAGHGDLIWSKADVVVPLIQAYLDALALAGAYQ
jgi:pimeloyl-ACP methyl ester carboxylesterase